MKRVFVFAALATLMVSAHAESTDRWFDIGMEWYEHPCGVRAFEKYGHDDTPAVRQAYFLTQKNPELCSKLFP